MTGNPSRAVGNFSYNGFAITSYPGSVASAWGNFSEYLTPSFPEVPTTGLVVSGSVGGSFSYLIPASNSPTSYKATGLPSGLSVNTTTGMISGTPTTAGTTTVSLTALNASGSGTATLTVRIVPPPPSITSVLSATGMQWNGFSYQIAAPNSPASFTASGLPSGLSLDPATGIISGIPDVSGTWNALLSAANDGGTSPVATLTLVILPAPLAITSALSVTGTDRSALSYQITTDNSPIGFGATALPAGLSINPGTGVISGTPTTTGTFPISISAFNVSGTGSAILTLTVAPSTPLITSVLSVTGTNGVAFAYPIQASDAPTSFSATGLPTGLSVNTSSGLVSGTPTVTGTITATIAASNAVGTGSASLIIGILPPPPPVPTSLAAISGSSQISLSWKASTGAASYNLKRSLTSGTGFVNIANVTGTSVVDTAVTNGTLYYYVVTAVGSSASESANSNSIGVMPGTLSSPWQWQNISASNIGGANVSGTTFALAACGSDIWSTSDSFGFIYQTGGTACRIVARLVTMDNPASNAKAGVMIRETLAANSAFVDAVLDTPSSVQSISRSAAGQTAVNSLTTSSITTPYWLKLVRSGTNFTSYISSNGTTWIWQKTMSVNMASSVFVGLPVTSHNTAAICSAVFDNVSVSGTLPAPPQISNYQVPVVVKFGDPLFYQITASNSPTYYTVTGLPAGLTYNSTTGSITGVPAGIGTSVITISAGNDGGLDTESLTIGVVSQPPTVTGSSATGTSGVAFTFQVAVTNTPTSYGATGLPAGLTLNTSTGLISGTPTLPGTFSANVSATNPIGTGSAALAITILPPLPVITSATSAVGINGITFNYQITATNTPSSYGATALPAGLTINTNTGLISGTPIITGTFSAGISASNVTGSGSGALVINLLPPPPAITSAASATGTNGKPFSYRITADGNPISYGASGLPAGLWADPVTGWISGTPTISGTFQPSIIASNGSGPGSATLTIVLVAAAGTVNTWTWDPLAMGNGSDGSGTWDNSMALFSSGTMDVIYAPGVATKSSGTTTVGSNIIKVTSTTGLVPGEALSLNNFSASTVVSSVSGTSVSLSTSATSAVANNTAFTFVDANDVAFGNGTDAAGTVSVSGTQQVGSMTINPASSDHYTFSNGTIILGTRYGSTGILTLNDSATFNSVLNFKGVSFATAGETLTLNGGSGTLGYSNGIITGTNAAISLASSLSLSSGTYTMGGVVMWNIGDMTNGTAGISIQPNATLNQNYNIFVGYFSNNPGLVTLNGGLWNIQAGSSLVLGRTYSGGANLQSGTLSSLGIITVGMNNPGVFNVNGGSLTSSTTLAVNSGNGNGTVNITGGTATVASVSFGGGGYGGTSTSGSGALNITAGSLYVGNGGIVKTGSGTSACSITLCGGVLGATADFSSSLPMILTNLATFQAADGANTARNITLSGILSGTGRLTKTGAGTLTLSGSSSYSGGTIVTDGTLLVNSASGSGVGTGPVTVSSGATLSGTGVVGGAVAVTGQLSPGLNGSGTMTINGDLTVGGTGSLQYGVGAPSSLVNVNGNMTLGGALNLFSSGILTTGTYRLINYSGSLTNNGLIIDSVPSDSFTYRVSTSIPGQVNLVVSIPTPLDAWKVSMFGADALNPAVSGDAVVNNSAQISNLMAYALGVIPSVAKAADLPTSAVKQIGGGRYLTLKFHRNTTASDISYVVESSSSPANYANWTPISTFTGGNWSPALNVIESGTAPQLNVEASDPNPTTSSSARFIRLKAIH